jgi:hypothetical protein
VPIKPYFKSPYLATIGIVIGASVLLPWSSPVAQERSPSLATQPPMTHPTNSQFSNPHPVETAKPDAAIAHLRATDFQFTSRITTVADSSSNASLEHHSEVLTSAQAGALDLTLIPLGAMTKYLVQVSRMPQQSCLASDVQACGPSRAALGTAAPARGTVAEIQIPLPTGNLQPGSYSFAAGGTTPRDEVITASPQLYSDPTHGQLGCQVWGGGTFEVKNVNYHADGTLALLDARLMRDCDQTIALPTSAPGTTPMTIKMNSIEQYTYQIEFSARF